MGERRVVDETKDETPGPARQAPESPLDQLIDSVLAIVSRINPHPNDETVIEHVAKLEALKSHTSSKPAARL